MPSSDTIGLKILELLGIPTEDVSEVLIKMKGGKPITVLTEHSIYEVKDNEWKELETLSKMYTIEEVDLTPHGK